MELPDRSIISFQARVAENTRIRPNLMNPQVETPSAVFRAAQGPQATAKVVQDLAEIERIIEQLLDRRPALPRNPFVDFLA